jgi:hypothetical protein
MVPEKVNVRTAKDGTMVATVGFGGGMPVETYRTDRFGRGLWRLEGGGWVRVFADHRFYAPTTADFRRFLYRNAGGGI